MQCPGCFVPQVVLWPILNGQNNQIAYLNRQIVILNNRLSLDEKNTQLGFQKTNEMQNLKLRNTEMQRYKLARFIEDRQNSLNMISYVTNKLSIS